MNSNFFKIPRRLWIIIFQGFASGLPVALVSSTLTAWYTTCGISMMSIGLLSLLGQPYIYKFLWAPLLDRFDPLGLGRRRSWMLLTQILITLCLAWMAMLTPVHNSFLLPALAFFTAFFSATQDIAISAYFTEAAGAHNRGLAAGFMTIGYRIALIMTTGMALVMAQYWGWRNTYLLLSGLMLLGVITTWFTPRLSYHETHTHTLQATFIDPFKELYQRLGLRHLLVVIAVLITYKLADGLSLALNSVFLLRTLHFSLAAVGFINKIFGFAAVLLGSLLGGLWMRRLSLFQALLLFGILQTLANFSFIWLYYSGHNLHVFALAVFIDNFCNGLGNIAFLALIMSLCHKEFTGTQYALLSAFMAVGRVYLGPAAALLVEHLGWVYYYLLTVVVGFGALVFLPFIPIVLQNAKLYKKLT